MRRIVLTAFALMVLLPSVAFARSEYACRIDGQVRLACCCPAPSHEAPRPTSLHDACCCTVLQGTRAQPTTEAVAVGARSHMAMVASAPACVAVVVPRAPLAIAPPPATVPPDRPRELFTRHCAFLL